MSKNWKFETKLIHGNKRRSAEGYTPTSMPIHMTAGFSYDTAKGLSDAFEGRQYGPIYSRISNPSITDVEQKIAASESGLGAVAVASGLAAISGVIYALCEAGDEIVASNSLFGGTMDYFDETVKKFGVTINYVDPDDLSDIKSVINDKTRFVFVEALGNPKLNVPDFDRLVALCKNAGVPLVLDTTMVTAALLDAKSLGVDIVVSSATKYISGHGNVIGGVVVDLGNFKWKEAKSTEVAEGAKKFGDLAFLAVLRRHVLHNAGSTLSPFNAFLIGLGLETLSLRMAQHCKNALALAESLESNSKVESVQYPGLASHLSYSNAKKYFKGGFGGILTFKLKDQEACFKCIDALNLAHNVGNLGDAKTLVIHPQSTIFSGRDGATCEAAGVSENLIRVSVGIEDSEDIINDFAGALA